MKLQTWLIDRREYARPVVRIDLDHQTCMSLTAHMSSSSGIWLSKDLEEWRDQEGKNGDIFVINTEVVLIKLALDVELSKTFRAGPGKLWD